MPRLGAYVVENDVLFMRMEMLGSIDAEYTERSVNV